MAIYRLSAKIVKRSDGRSATAAAAYRAGAIILDERTGLVFDYSRRGGVTHTEILAPPDIPATMLDQAHLWNLVEASERRRDAQVAREIELALPHELTRRQRLDLVRGFVRREFVARGMIADLAIHCGDRRGDHRNHHAHVLLTLRPFTCDRFGPKARDWNDTEVLEQWREAWADAVNQALATRGHKTRVDHRSYADQGVPLEAEPKMGPVATTMERRGRRSHAGNDRRAARARNDHRVKATTTLTEIDAKLAAKEETAVVPPASVLPAMPTTSVQLGTKVNHPDASRPPRRQRRAPRQSPGWVRYLYSIWTTVARAITAPFRILRAVKTRRKRPELNR